MDYRIATHQAKNYQVSTPVFEGPLDLLLHLIERSELDITSLALAQVTDQYLAYIHEISNIHPDEISAFLVIAAKLLQIKSEALLPRPPIREVGEEDPAEALALQLRLYKQYKQVAFFLSSRRKLGLQSYLRLASPPKVEGQLDLQGMTANDLAQAARLALAKADMRPHLRTVVTPAPVTIRQKILAISKNLRSFGKTTFSALIKSTRSRIHIVVTFLAMLELVKRRRIRASQAALFEDIEMEPAEDWEGGIDFELEFGE